MTYVVSTNFKSSTTVTWTVVPRKVIDCTLIIVKGSWAHVGATSLHRFYDSDPTLWTSPAPYYRNQDNKSYHGNALRIEAKTCRDPHCQYIEGADNWWTNPSKPWT
jgi:hypothetical protein